MHIITTGIGMMVTFPLLLNNILLGMPSLSSLYVTQSLRICLHKNTAFKKVEPNE